MLTPHPMDATALNWPPVIERPSSPATPNQNDETLTTELVEAFASLVHGQVGGLTSEGGVIKLISGSNLSNLLFSVELGDLQDLPAIQRARWALLNAALSEHYTGFRFAMTAKPTNDYVSYGGREGSDHDNHFINYSPETQSNK